MQRTHFLGGTQLIVPSNGVLSFVAPPDLAGGMLKILSGGGTLFLQNSPTFGTGGYPIGATEIIELKGPASFFLAAVGATMTVAFAPRFSAGLSQF